MTKILASSKLDKFDLNGELDELTPQVKNGLYKKFNFEGAVNTYVNLKESKILVLQRFENGDINSLLSSKCKITYKNIKEDINFFTNLSIDTAKTYDLIIFDSHAWAVPLNDLNKSIELTNNGIPCLLIGDDTLDECYGAEARNISVTSNSDVARSYIIKDNIPFSMDDYSYTNLPDYCNYPTKMANDKMFPILKCKNFYPMIAYESPCNTISICDNTAGFARNQTFFFKIIKWLISTKKCVELDEGILFGDGAICQEPYKNLWTRYITNGVFSSSPIRGNWSTVTDFPFGIINQFEENPRIIKCEPNKGMNYCTIKSSNDLQNYPDSQYPSGTKYRLSCWVYVEENCDMSTKAVRLMGEMMTPGCANLYDFNKKGTWQYLSTTITSRDPGFYFLLYCNTGYEEAWTKGNVYFANVTICKAPYNESRRYVKYEKSESSNQISINDINSNKNFTLIYEYNQQLNYSGNFPTYTGKEIMHVYSKGKKLAVSDWYGPNTGSNPLVGFDDFVTRDQEPWWHLHMSSTIPRNINDKHYIVLRKIDNEFSWYFTKNSEIFRSSIINVSKYQELVDFNIEKVIIRPGHGGLVKSLSIYNRALSFDEIEKIVKDKKYMSISLDGNLNTNNLSEQPWIPENCFYMSLAKDNCKNYMRIEGDIVHQDDWAYAGNVKNYLGKNCLIPSSDLVTCTYDENENEYTVHVPKDDSMQWYEKAVKIDWVKVEGNEKYAMTFDFYCDKDMYIGIDINNTTNGISSNDNHENTVTNIHEKQIGGRYNHLYITYDLMDNSPTFSCWNAIYISTAETIPPEGITFKLKNVCLHKIKGGKTNNYQNIYYPYTEGDTYVKNFKFNLYEDINFKWNEPWTICYFKKPIGANKLDDNTERFGYVIDSIGCNNNSVGGGYHWFGKITESNNISLTSRYKTNFDENKFFYLTQFCSLRYDGNRILYTIYFNDGQKIEIIHPETISSANRYVTQFGYDLLLDGWDNGAICQAFYKDLIVAQRCLTDKELEKIFKARIIDKPNNTNISNLLIEGGI